MLLAHKRKVPRDPTQDIATYKARKEKAHSEGRRFHEKTRQKAAQRLELQVLTGELKDHDLTPLLDLGVCGNEQRRMNTGSYFCRRCCKTGSQASFRC